MNCDRFKDLLEEHVDETLSPRDRAAADEHAAGCAACAEELRRRRETGEHLANILRETTQSLRLDPAIERRVLREWPGKAAPRAAEWFANGLLRRWAAAAAFVVAVILVAAHFTGSPTAGSKPTRHRDESLVVEVTYRAPVHVFQQEGEYVRDTLNYETVTVNTRLGPEHDSAGSSKQ